MTYVKLLLEGVFIALGATAAVVAGALVLANRQSDDCPKLWLGYNRCNRWSGQPCDHSQEEWARVKEGLKRA